MRIFSLRGGVLSAGAALVGASGSIAALLRWQSRRMRRTFDADAARGTSRDQGQVISASPAALRYGSAAAEGLPVLAVVGDSWLCAPADEGADPAVLMGRGLARLCDSPVRVRSLAAPAARAEDVSDQVGLLLADPGVRRPRGGPRTPRFAVISMGSADLIHPFSGSLSIPVLTNAINRLQREGGYTVVVLSCPNLGRLPGIRDPLRTALRRSSRVLAGSQWITAVSTGAIPLSVTQILRATTRVSLIAAGGRAPTGLGRAQLATAVIAALAAELEAPVGLNPSAHDPAAQQSAPAQEPEPLEELEPPQPPTPPQEQEQPEEPEPQQQPEQERR